MLTRHATVRAILALVIVAGVGLAVTSAASADSSKIKFRAEAHVTGVGPGATTSAFEYRKDGSIKTVTITTVGESVLAGPLNVECRRRDGPACDPLDGSMLLDVHSSIEVLKQVEVVDNPLAPGAVDALAGKLSGELDGALTVTNPDVALAGTMRMKIRGTATLGCFVLPLDPAKIQVCESGEGFLLPVVFDVEDHGTFEIDSGELGGVPVSGGGGHVRATIAGSPAAGVTGRVTIGNATLFVDE